MAAGTFNIGSMIRVPRNCNLYVQCTTRFLATLSEGDIVLVMSSRIIDEEPSWEFVTVLTQSGLVGEVIFTPLMKSECI